MGFRYLGQPAGLQPVLVLRVHIIHALSSCYRSSSRQGLAVIVFCVLATFRERCYVITVITVEVGPQEEIDKGKSLTKKPAKSEPRQTFDNEPVAVSKWHDILWWNTDVSLYLQKTENATITWNTILRFFLLDERSWFDGKMMIMIKTTFQMYEDDLINARLAEGK